MIKPKALTLLTRQSSQDGELCRLLSAAVVNRHFCSLLLSNPAAAASEGYGGEYFQLNHTDMAKLQAIHADTLKEFAIQLAAI